MKANLHYEVSKKKTMPKPTKSVASKQFQKRNEIEIENSINTLEHDTEVEPDLPMQINLSIKYHERKSKLLNGDESFATGSITNGKVQKLVEKVGSKRSTKVTEKQIEGS